MQPSITEIALAHGLRPPVDSIVDEFVGPGWFSHIVSIPNAATTAQSLRNGAIFTTDASIAERWGTNADSQQDRIVHVEQVHVNIFGGAWQALALTEKQKLVEGLEMMAKQGGAKTRYSLGDHIMEAYQDQLVTFDSDNTSASVVYGALNGPPLVLPRPLTLDLSSDEWELQFNTATPAGPIKAHFRWYGFAAVKTLDIIPKSGVVTLPNGERAACGKRGVFGAQHGLFDQASGLAGARALELGRKTR